MIGLLGFVALWGLARWRGWRAGPSALALAAWWAVLILGTAPGLAPRLAAFLGGDVRLWLLSGPVAVLVLLYRAGLRRLKAKARLQVGEKAEAGATAAKPAQPAAAADAASQPRPVLQPEEVARYSRHILLHEIGGPGQQMLKRARVLVVGAGGLGAPALLYLAAAGVGRLTVVDDDVVEPSNLQRQIIHRQDQIGEAKVDSAARAIRALNPHVEVVPHRLRLSADDIAPLIAGQDLVLDGTDNFDTRYLVNRACAAAGVPLIAAAMTQWEGQLSLYDPARGGPCYECLFPERPAPGLVPSCAEAGVLGPLPGVMGAMMAVEAVKALTSAGEGMRGRLFLYDALHGETRTVTVARRAGCLACAPHQGGA